MPKQKQAVEAVESVESEQVEATEVKVKGPMVKGRVLRACPYGQCDDVVEVPADQVESLAGIVDTDPAAVAYAESLKA